MNIVTWCLTRCVARSLSLRPQRVPVSSICDDNQSGGEDEQADTATASHNSATIGTVSAILTASRSAGAARDSAGSAWSG